VPPEDKPEIVDLVRYRQAAKTRESKAKRAETKANRAGGPRGGGREPLLGSRPRAGLILILLIAGFLALWLGPELLRG